MCGCERMDIFLASYTHLYGNIFYRDIAKFAEMLINIFEAYVHFSKISYNCLHLWSWDRYLADIF